MDMFGPVIAALLAIPVLAIVAIVLGVKTETVSSRSNSGWPGSNNGSR